MRIYLIGALKNPKIPEYTNFLEGLGFEVFSDWWAASEDADDWLRDYYKSRGYNYKQTLGSHAAQHIFSFDKQHLDRADIGVMVMPAGKSGHLELGYIIGQHKPGFILFDKEPERVDIMHNFATEVFFSVDELGQALSKYCQGGQQQVQRSLDQGGCCGGVAGQPISGDGLQWIPGWGNGFAGPAR